MDEMLAALATMADPDPSPDPRVRWERVPTPGGGWIDTQQVESRSDGYRRRLLVVEFNPADPEHARRIGEAIRMLEE